MMALISQVNPRMLASPPAAISQHAAVLGYREAFLACFALLLIPFVLAFFIDDKKAAEILSRRVAAVEGS